MWRNHALSSFRLSLILTDKTVIIAKSPNALPQDQTQFDLDR